MTTSQHPFERAGLGRAPFRFVRVEYRVFHACPGAPAQAGGSCDYCGTGIMEHCFIKDADGREFKVGNECVARTGDAPLQSSTKQAVNKLRRERLHAKQDAEIQNAVIFAKTHRSDLESIIIETKIGARPLASRFDWMMKNAGRAGKLRAIEEMYAAVCGGNRTEDFFAGRILDSGSKEQAPEKEPCYLSEGHSAHSLLAPGATCEACGFKAPEKEKAK